MPELLSFTPPESSRQHPSLVQLALAMDVMLLYTNTLTYKSVFWKRLWLWQVLLRMEDIVVSRQLCGQTRKIYFTILTKEDPQTITNTYKEF